MQSFLSIAGIAVLGISIWYELKWLPLDPPIPLGLPLLLYGVFLIACEIAVADAN